MKRILLDTNVVLDVLLDRPPFVDEARQIWDASDRGLCRFGSGESCG